MRGREVELEKGLIDLSRTTVFGGLRWLFTLLISSSWRANSLPMAACVLSIKCSLAHSLTHPNKMKGVVSLIGCDSILNTFCEGPFN